MYVDFAPLLMHQLQGSQLAQFPTFDEALDEFFSKVSDAPVACDLRFVCLCVGVVCRTIAFLLLCMHDVL